MIEVLMESVIANPATAGGMHIFDLFTETEMEKKDRKEEFPLSGMGEGQDGANFSVEVQPDGNFLVSFIDQNGQQQDLQMTADRDPDSNQVELNIVNADAATMTEFSDFKAKLETEVNKYQEEKNAGKQTGASATSGKANMDGKSQKSSSTSSMSATPKAANKAPQMGRPGTSPQPMSAKPGIATTATRVIPALIFSLMLSMQFLFE